jgi:hypothetical protein
MQLGFFGHGIQERLRQELMSLVKERSITVVLVLDNNKLCLVSAEIRQI